MELSEQGRKLLAVLVAEIAKGKLNPDKPEGFLGYRQTLDLLKLPSDAPVGETDGQTLQLNGLNELAAWIHQHPKRLPRLTGLIVAKEPRVYADGTRRPANVPGPKQISTANTARFEFRACRFNPLRGSSYLNS